MMKKFFLSISLMAVFAWYVTFHNQATVPTVADVPQETKPRPITRFLREDVDEDRDDDYRPVTQRAPTPVPTSLPTPTPIASNPNSPKPTPIAKGTYKDGSYVGDPTDAYYGTIQVRAIIQNGKITDVVFLDHPQDRSTSREINNAAMPLLKSEAIRAQSAQVNGVSGATYSSEAFKVSLASALAKAKN